MESASESHGWCFRRNGVVLIFSYFRVPHGQIGGLTTRITLIIYMYFKEWRINTVFFTWKGCFEGHILKGSIQVFSKIMTTFSSITTTKAFLSKHCLKKSKKYGSSPNWTFSPPCLLLAEIEWDHEILTNFTPPQVPWVIHFQPNAHFRATDGGKYRKHR